MINFSVFLTHNGLSLVQDKDLVGYRYFVQKKLFSFVLLLYICDY